MTAATDPMGQAARHASILTDGLGRDLLVASSKFAKREEREAAIVRACSTWPKVCRAMVDVLASAPNAAVAGELADAQMVDFMEGRRGA